MPKHFFKYLFFLFFLLGCTVKPVQAPKNEVEQLSSKLQALQSGISYKKSRLLAQDIFKQTQRLTKKFELTSPPLWHNFLVNIGIREKGLCYHWSDALYVHLEQKNYEHFSFYLIGANIGKYFSEHNALLIVSKGARSIKGGVVIDPWRESGKLYFTTVENDKEYTWKRRKVREPAFLQ